MSRRMQMRGATSGL